MLELMGATFLVIVAASTLAGAAAVMQARQRLRQDAIVAAIEETLADAPVPVIEAEQEFEWHHPEAANVLCQDLHSLGLRAFGTYCFAEASNARLQAYQLDTPSAYLVVTDHIDMGCWLDLVMFTATGSITYSSMPPGNNTAERPPEHELILVGADAHPGSVIGYARSRALNLNPETVEPSQFVERFNQVLAALRASLDLCHVDQSWLESIAEYSGVRLRGDEAESINAGRELQRHERIVGDCLKSYAASSGMSAVQWEQVRNELLVIYDELPKSVLVEVLYQSMDIPQGFEGDLLMLEDATASSRLATRQFINTLPADELANGYALIREATINSPVCADIYRVVMPQAQAA